MIEVRICLAGCSGSAAELSSLNEWLCGEEDLRGAVRVVQRRVEAGELGSLTEALMLVLGPGGAATAAASALISWVRHQRADITVEVTVPDGTTVTVEAKRVKDLTTVDLARQVERLGRAMTGSDEHEDDVPDGAGG